MATETNSFLQQIHTARTRVQTCFSRAHELLAAKETTLLSQLEDIQNKYETDSKCYQDELQGLEKSEHSLNSLLRNNDTLNEALAAINRNVEQIVRLGEVFTTAVSQASSMPVTPNYRKKPIPVITCGKHNETNTPGDFNYPTGLAIEPQTGIIYIADADNHRVQAFTPNGEYCFMFDNKMNRPLAICISNDTVYVSQFYGYCINLYKLDGNFIKSVGSKGISNGHFNSLAGIAISSMTGHLYICDWGNDRLQVFNESLKFHLTFGNDFVRYPMDVNLTSELVFVLDKNNPCMHLFNIADHSLLNSIISRGAGKQIEHSLFFTVDKGINLILTDAIKHCVIVFSKSGEVIAQFGKEGHSVGEFTYPTGVALDNENRIVVVSHNQNTAIQIF